MNPFFAPGLYRCGRNLPWRGQRKGAGIPNPPAAAWLPRGQTCANLKNGLMIMSLKSTPQTPVPWEETGGFSLLSAFPSTATLSIPRISSPTRLPSVLHICYLSLQIPPHGCSQPAGLSPFFPECSPRTAQPVITASSFLVSLCEPQPPMPTLRDPAPWRPLPSAWWDAATCLLRDPTEVPKFSESSPLTPFPWVASWKRAMVFWGTSQHRSK